jgi:hypothetical protein
MLCYVMLCSMMLLCHAGCCVGGISIVRSRSQPLLVLLQVSVSQLLMALPCHPSILCSMLPCLCCHGMHRVMLLYPCSHLKVFETASSSLFCTQLLSFPCTRLALIRLTLSRTPSSCQAAAACSTCRLFNCTGQQACCCALHYHQNQCAERHLASTAT